MKNVKVQKQVETGGRRVRSLGLVLFVAGLATACFGEAEPDEPTVGSESHFLRLCEETCADGLDCIAGICTSPCVVGDSESCEQFPAAACTNQSVEPGEVAVCDVPCSGDVDCSVLSQDHACWDGFCRAPMWKTAVDFGSYDFTVPYWTIPVDATSETQIRCTDLALPYLEDGTLACKYVEVSSRDADRDCQLAARRPVSAAVEELIRAHWDPYCEGADDECDEYVFCEIEQLSGAARDACYFDAEESGTLKTSGFCAINPTLQDAQGSYVAGGGPDGTNSFVDVCPQAYSASAFRHVGAAQTFDFAYLVCGSGL